MTISRLRGGMSALAAILQLSWMVAVTDIAFAQSPSVYPLPTAWVFVRPDVVNASVYFSDRWGIRFDLPRPNVWCGTSGATDRGGVIVLRADADCGSAGRREDIYIYVRVRWNTSGIDDDLPPIREMIARAHCEARAKSDPTFRALPRIAGLPAFECFGDKAARGPHEGLFLSRVILFRGDKSGGQLGEPPYPMIEYFLEVIAPPERAGEARALLSRVLETVRLRPF